MSKIDDAVVIVKEWTTRAGFAAKVIEITSGERKCYGATVGVLEGHPMYGIDARQPIPSLEVTDELVAVMRSMADRRDLLTVSVHGTAQGYGCSRKPPPACPFLLFDVHGGIICGDSKMQGIPFDGTWWFFFHAMHSDMIHDCPMGDAPISGPQKDGALLPGKSRGVEYMISECEKLAGQILGMFPAATV